MARSLEKEVCDLTERIGMGYGADPLHIKLVTTLFLEPDPISLEDLAKKTGYGLSTMSGKMKFLVSSQLVHRTSKPGSRKAYFLMKKDLREILAAKFNMMTQIHLNPITTELPVILKKHKEEIIASDDPVLKKKYEILKTYLGQVKKIRKIMKETVQKIQEI